MSGHSKWSQIKRQKGVADSKRGQIFTKLANAIIVAARSGGTNPDTNFRLRLSIEEARKNNMPKENIERAISKGAKEGENLEEIKYEGFGPGGIAIIVEAATDSRNRTGQEIKNIFERVGGNLAGPGSVSFNFEPKGLLLLEKQENLDSQMLSLIDLGVEDIVETEDGLEVYVSPDKLTETRDSLQNAQFKIMSYELFEKPKNSQVISDPIAAHKVLNFLDTLENQDDVQKVYANIDIPQEILKNLNSIS